MQNFKFKRALLVLFMGITCITARGQGISIGSSAHIKTTGNPSFILINGNLTNNGTWYSSGTEKVTISWNTAKTMEGAGSTDMYDLCVANTGGITQKLTRINVHDLEINPSCRLTIDTCKLMNVSNIINNQAGTSGIYIKSSSDRANGSLIFHNNVASPVSATVEMYSKAYAGTYTNGKYSNYKWQFFGIPLRTLTASPAFNGSFVRKFNEAGTGTGSTSDKHWIDLVNGSALTPFTGYEVTHPTPKTILFAGELVNSDYASGKLPLTPTAQYPGQHLIGNPYTAAIDIKKIQFGSARSSVIANTVYLYNTGSYSDWETGAGQSGKSYGEAPGQFQSVPKNLAGSAGLPAQIPSMQAFLVVAASDNDSANIIIPYSSVGTVTRNTDKQRTKSIESGKVCTIIDVTGSRYSDRMWLFTEPDCTKGFDNGWDGHKFLGSVFSPQIWSMEQSGDYQVNSKDNINGTVIGFLKGEDSEYTLTFRHENIEPIYQSLYLIDLQDNTITNITLNGSQYKFIATQPTNQHQRFKIVTAMDAITQKPEDCNDLSKIKIINSGNTIYISNPKSKKGHFALYSCAGKEILKSKLSEGTTTSVSCNFPAGSYIVKVKTTSEETTEKLIIK